MECWLGLMFFVLWNLKVEVIVDVYRWRVEVEVNVYLFVEFCKIEVWVGIVEVKFVLFVLFFFCLVLKILYIYFSVCVFLFIELLMV